MELSLQTDTVADRTVVRVSGEIDLYTVPRLKQRLIDLIEAGARHLVVDLGGVGFIDSTGYGVLVLGMKLLRAQGGTLVLVCAQDRVPKIFRLSGFDQIFTIVPTVDEAVVAGDAGSADR